MQASRVLAALSGGVDSAVAAALMLTQGYYVTGIMMTTYSGNNTTSEITQKQGCYGPGELDNVIDAQKIAETLGITLEIFNLEKEYLTSVLDYTKREYNKGRTPNPCVHCNQSVKLGALIEKARLSGLEFDFVITGHYARTDYDPATNRYRLLRGQAHDKDQSYFLSRLSQKQLQMSRFPLGEMTKNKVRQVADQLNLSVAAKKESQNFIAGGYRQLICNEAKPGRILDQSGKILGHHQGISYFTVGQRHGLGIASPNPLYVYKIDPDNNVIIVGEKEVLYKQDLKATDLNWISISNLDSSLKVTVKIRSNASPVPALIEPVNSNLVAVYFDKPQMAPTPGQVVVFYDEDTVLGSGIISN